MEQRKNKSKLLHITNIVTLMHVLCVLSAEHQYLILVAESRKNYNYETKTQEQVIA